MQSMEGHRGEPRPKIYFPTHRGFLQKPTSGQQCRNLHGLPPASLNWELFRFENEGPRPALGTKVLIGCRRLQPVPGIYEIEWGIEPG